MQSLTALLASTAGALIFTFAAAALPPRELPRPRSEHPGNIFLSGEEISIPVSSAGTRWTLTDYEGRALTNFMADDGMARLGQLGVGHYQLRQNGGSNAIFLGVIAPLRALTPQSSPIGIDVAMAWFYPKEKMPAVASLCSLAGVNWVRDRLNWSEMQPSRDRLSAPNKYDASASAQSAAGLHVLQVIHASPSWANTNHKRFPTDLRDAHRFFAEMARRWRGQVAAFEPWNEADIPMFGGHTGAEMASLQKAAYLGLKSGNPDMIACLNVFALHQTNQLADLDDNEAWAYFDSYNLHHYEPFDRYPRLYADHRAVSAGRPLWVSECSVPVRWSGDEKVKEPTDTDLKVQAERVSKTFACSLHEGSAATFYFLLPHYVEGPTQFGILRPDLTPRPAYIALAAVGRLLADAKPLGRLKSDDAAVRGYLFRARPDGESSQMLVAWTTNNATELRLPITPTRVFDHLGRTNVAVSKLQLTGAPQFVVFDADAARSLAVVPPAAKPLLPPGTPSPIVLQALWPEERTDLKRSAYRLPTNGPVTIPVYAYNFGGETARGSLKLTAPSGWRLEAASEIKLPPNARTELAVTLANSANVTTNAMNIRVDGDFGPVGKPVLSLRVVQQR